MVRYIRRPGVEAAPMQAETILYHPAAKTFCVLNPSAAYLWEQLAQPRTEPELAAALAEGFAVSPGTDLAADVRASLERFASFDLVVPSPDALSPAQEARRG